jgi:hypothetical protein
MGIAEVVNSDENSLGVAGEEKIKEGNRGQDRCKEHEEVEMVEGFEKEINTDS